MSIAVFVGATHVADTGPAWATVVNGFFGTLDVRDVPDADDGEP